MQGFIAIGDEGRQKPSSLFCLFGLGREEEAAEIRESTQNGGEGEKERGRSHKKTGPKLYYDGRLSRPERERARKGKKNKP